MNIVKSAHKKVVSDRRVSVLSRTLAGLIPENASVLDIGCGDGGIACGIKRLKKVSVEGVEIMRRPKCMIKCDIFDGSHIPRKSSSVDVTMLVDVLHHTPDIKELLAEARRVSRKYVLIKDHLSESRENYLTLRFMDWIGNRPHGVRLVYNYRSRSEWEKYFDSLNLKVMSWNDCIRIHRFPLNLFFGRRLHFVALLEKTFS